MAYGRALIPGLERNRQAWTLAASALRRPAQPDLFLAVVVCASYFTATLVGLALRLPPSTPSVVWPPNSILTTALLFAPVSRWWVVLLAALPAHLYLQSGVFPLPMAMSLFATNCSEALIAASLIRRFNDQPTRFDTLHRVTVFLVAGGLLAPAISSLLDAAVVARFTPEPYWHVWKVRLWSNMLSAVAIIPAIACVVDTGHRGMLAWPRARWIESAIIATLLGVTLIGSTASASVSELVGLPSAAALLSLLLWTAVRFGPAGVSISLLASVIILVGAATSGLGPLDAIPTDLHVVIVQTFLLATGVPFMCVAALIEERRQAERAVHTAETTKAAILASLPSHVAVLDGNGTVIDANRHWAPFAASVGLGSNHDSAARHGEWQLPNAESRNERGWRQAIRDVQERRLAEFTQEYSHGTGDLKRWYSVTIVPLQRPGGGIVMTHTDVTERYRAELAAQKSREELAHVTRVWVLGELTASLSHQLNQPLTAISGNARAGRRFVESGMAASADLAGVFDDIAADATRAAEIVKDVRDLLRKDTGGREGLDLNDLITRTLQLIRGEALTRNIQLHLSAAPALPHVRGNRVQLQQVVLNLVVNAMESIADSQAERLISISTAFEPPAAARVQVRDTGGGFAHGVEAQIFEPFYTTKAAGMGMGLAIARAIVDAHGGMLTAEPMDRGAKLTFTVPLTTDEAGRLA